MIKSMTGFGRCETAENNRKFTVEMKSVNHRYLDVNIKMPKKLNFFESAIRSELKNYISRGKVDLFITYEDFSENTSSVRYNKELAAEYLGYLKQMASDFDLDCDIRVSTLSKYPDVFVMEEQDIDEEELWKELQRALKGACEMFVQTRITEGEHLRDDLIAKLDGIDVNFSAEKPTLIVHNVDQPGHVAQVTTMLAEKQVNIATLQLYRDKRGGYAVMVIETDQEVPEESVTWLEQLDGIIKVTYINVEE